MLPTLRDRADTGVGREAVTTGQRPIIPSCSSVHRWKDGAQSSKNCGKTDIRRRSGVQEAL
jgi:hypothetical protein